MAGWRFSVGATKARNSLRVTSSELANSAGKDCKASSGTSSPLTSAAETSLAFRSKSACQSARARSRATQKAAAETASPAASTIRPGARRASGAVRSVVASVMARSVSRGACPKRGPGARDH